MSSLRDESMTDDMTYHIAFVCLGNICRSPMAEKIFLARVSDSPVAERLVVSSAGTSGWHAGEAMDRRAAATLRRHGYPTDHSGSGFTPADLELADLVLAMDSSNLESLLSLTDDPALRAKIRLFRTFDPAAEEGAEVPDPYFGGDRGFEDVLRMVEAAADGLVDHLERTLS